MSTNKMERDEITVTKFVDKEEDGTFYSFKRRRESSPDTENDNRASLRSPCKDFSNNVPPSSSFKKVKFGGLNGNDENVDDASVLGITRSLHASSLNSVPYPKVIHVDQQNRFIVESRLTKVVTKGMVVITYKIKSDKDGSERLLILKDMWAQIDWMAPGTLINLVEAKTDDKGSFIVERLHGYLIVEPDSLVSATSVIGQMYCERKSAFSRMSFGGDNILLFRGVVAHELICVAMVNKVSQIPELKKIAKRICQRPQMLEKAYACGMSDADLEALQNEVIPWVSRFINQRFLSPKVDPKYQSFKFRKVVGVEDCVWNPTFGLKGKIDATVVIEKDSDTKVVPLEFKTGSTKTEKRQQLKADHMGQVALYTLMMSIKYGLTHEAILYYISDDSLSLHATKKIELQHLIANRNKQLRHSTLENGDLQYLPRAEADYNFKCKTCEVRSLCTLDIKKRYDPTTKLTGTEASLVGSLNLTDAELNFFHDWFQVINCETEEVERRYSDKYLWTRTPHEREEAGTCVTGLKLMGGCVPTNDGCGKEGYLISLVRPTSNQLGSCQSDTNFKVDDFIALSSNVEVCINYGVVVDIRKNEIKVFLDQPLHEDYVHSDFTYTVDKISTTSPIASQYGYLLKLMEDTPEAARLRDYIINRKQPKFEKMLVPDEFVYEVIKNLNYEQTRVICKALSTDSFLFVKGIPGSGKTTTIVCLLRTLIYHKKTVLVVSYTGSALENILIKYKKHDKNFVKISTSGRADSSLMEFTTKKISTSVKGVDELANAYNMVPLVGTTLLSLRHPIFQNRKFDYCVIDEASQALPTAVFGALSFAEKYIVFGDPNQLPPVMQSSILKRKNMCDNFFSLMATPVSTMKLNTQYRMNCAINNLANQLIYDNQMKCGSEALAKSRIKLTEGDIRSFLLDKVSSPPARALLCKAVSKKAERAVMFLDTSNISAFETKADETISNEAEQFITVACVRLFIECNLRPSKLGIIAPYRGQVNLIRSFLKKMQNDDLHNIEVNTVDQYQGREMEVIICSFTKSLPSTSNFFKDGIGNKENENKVNILEDLRRLNVAVTRAKRKLVLIGNRHTLTKFAPFQKLFSILNDEQICPVTQDGYQGLQVLAKSGLRTES